VRGLEVTVTDAHGRRQKPQRYVIDLSHLIPSSMSRSTGSTMRRRRCGGSRVPEEVDGRPGPGEVWTRDGDRYQDAADVEEFLIGHRRLIAYEPPPEWVMALARNVFVRAVVEAIPPVHRWVRRRYGPDE
jgi:hypothetical protein